MLRPAKNIERKLIRDIVARILHLNSPKDYQYIGFGSKYFTDFINFHKYLHIDDMISIESDTNAKQRYEFNKPLSCIDLKFGHSNKIIPELDLNRKIFAWLDYDSIFGRHIISDLATLISSAKSCSIVMVSYNSKPFRSKELKEEFQSETEKGLLKRKLISLAGEELVPQGLEERGLHNWKKFSPVLREIIDSQIQSSLSSRNAGASEEERWNYKQLFYFDYNDGVEMSTVGGVVFQNKDKNLIDNCTFDDFEFISSDSNRCLIEVPNFTTKEIKVLLENMPLNTDNEKIDKDVFNKNDVDKFSKFYRYYPHYLETEMA